MYKLYARDRKCLFISSLGRGGGGMSLFIVTLEEWWETSERARRQPPLARHSRRETNETLLVGTTFRDHHHGRASLKTSSGNPSGPGPNPSSARSFWSSTYLGGRPLKCGLALALEPRVNLRIVEWSFNDPDREGSSNKSRALHFVPMGAHLVYIGHPCRPNGRPWAQNVGPWIGVSEW